MRKRLACLALLASIYGCGETQHAQEKPLQPRKLTVAGAFQTKRIQITDTEYVRVLDLPDRIMPTRCWVYVNDVTKTSHMHCDSDEATTQDLPIQGAELER